MQSKMKRLHVFQELQANTSSTFMTPQFATLCVSKILQIPCFHFEIIA